MAKSDLGKQLVALDFGGNSVTDKGIAFFLSGGDYALRRLSLRGNRLTVGGVMAVLDSSRLLGQLLSLDVSLNPLDGDELAQELAACPSASRLRELRLQQTGMTSRGASALAGSEYLSGLAVLSVTGNRIGEDGKDQLRAKFGPRLRSS